MAKTQTSDLLRILLKRWLKAKTPKQIRELREHTESILARKAGRPSGRYWDGTKEVLLKKGS